MENAFLPLLAVLLIPPPSFAPEFWESNGLGSEQAAGEAPNEHFQGYGGVPAEIAPAASMPPKETFLNVLPEPFIEIRGFDETDPSTVDFGSGTKIQAKFELALGTQTQWVSVMPQGETSAISPGMSLCGVAGLSGSQEIFGKTQTGGYRTPLETAQIGESSARGTPLLEVPKVSEGNDPRTGGGDILEQFKTLGRDRPVFQVALPTTSADSPNAVLDTGKARELAQFLYRESLERLPKALKIRIDPPELGKVTVLLAKRGERVAVRFTASPSAAKLLSEAHLSLEKALQDAGLMLSGFAVDDGGNSGAESRGFQEEKRRGRRARKRQNLTSMPDNPWSIPKPGSLYEYLA